MKLPIIWTKSIRKCHFLYSIVSSGGNFYQLSVPVCAVSVKDLMRNICVNSFFYLGRRLRSRFS